MASNREFHRDKFFKKLGVGIKVYYQWNKYGSDEFTVDIGEERFTSPSCSGVIRKARVYLEERLA